LKLLNRTYYLLSLCLVQLFFIAPHNVFSQKERCHYSYANENISFNNDYYTERRNTESICIVFHIIQTLDENRITDERIESQLERINNDFQRFDEDLSLIPELFQVDIGTTNFEFVLADTDPDGLPSTGIVRIETDLQNIGSLISQDGKEVIKFSSLGGSDAWRPDSCINVWVGATTDVFGITAPLDLAGTDEDGIIIAPEAFGFIENPSSPSTNLGRTLTHELGHYFGLSHLWGSDIGCDEGDGIEDTPQQDGPYINCPDFPQVSCGSADMHNNFMEFTDDECLLFFTRGQVQRMNLVLEEVRSGIIVASSDLSGGTGLSFEIRQSDEGLDIVHENKASRFASISIYTTTGQLLLREQINSINVHRINTNNWPRAVYILSIRDVDRRFTHTFIAGS